MADDAFKETRKHWREMKALWSGLDADGKADVAIELGFQLVGGALMGLALALAFGWPALLFVVGAFFYKVGNR